jgi:hypothetical protein
MRAQRRELYAAGVAVLALVCLLVTTGCAALTGEKAALTGEKIVLERGHSAQNRPWQLAANEQDGQLGLYLESPYGREYSGGVGFSAGPAAGFWMEGPGPDGDFFYGPAPAAAVTVRLSAPGHAPILVRTRPLPSRAGLPRGRFFITQPPGPGNVNWNVTLLDAAGHKVAFADF